MAYLKHFSGFFSILTLLTLLSGTNIINAESASLRLRPASKSAATNLKNQKYIETYYTNKLQELGIDLRPGALHRSDSKPTLESSKRCKSIVYKTLLELPYSHRNQLANLTLFYTADGRRGLGGGNSIILRCNSVMDEELSSVLVHEIGHLVDDTFLFGTSGIGSGFYDFETPIYTDDPSLYFYKISWSSEKIQRQNSTSLDFVSLYAATDPFEDFAETYTYFRFHGPEFRHLVKFNSALRQKYDFMKNYVFYGQEFGNVNNQIDMNVWTRNYDVTVLPITS